MLENKPKLHIIMVCEYDRSSGAATGALASDLYERLEREGKATLEFLCVKKKYQPGGAQLSRIFNLLYLHIACFFKFFVLFVRQKLVLRKQVLTIAITTPPFIHWTTSVLSRLLGFKSVVWYFDAHPEIEARIAIRKKLKFVGTLFRAAEKIFSAFYQKIVTLDDAMAIVLQQNSLKKLDIEIVPPWSTFIEPSKALRAPPQESIKILYAGNYNSTHDLTEFTQQLTRFAEIELAKFEFVFVGMNDSSRQTLEKVFSGVSCKKSFLPRRNNFGEVLELMQSCHFGLTSLNPFFTGLVCPSKAFTYVSQGLPILYFGGENTMSWKMCHDGWGVTAEQFFESIRGKRETLNVKNVGKVFENPTDAALNTFLKILGYDL